MVEIISPNPNQMFNYGLEKGKILSPLTNNNTQALVKENSSPPEMVIKVQILE